MSNGLLASIRRGRLGARAASAGAPNDLETEAGSGPEDEEDAERAPEASADQVATPATDDATASTPAAADGDEEDDEDESPRADAPADAASFDAGQRAERARWASVMPAAIVAGQGAAAAELLTTSEMTADAVTSFLANHSTAGPAAAGFVDRMRAQKPADIGADAPGEDDPGARLLKRADAHNERKAGRRPASRQ
jgi:hypothetical protein